MLRAPHRGSLLGLVVLVLACSSPPPSGVSVTPPSGDGSALPQGAIGLQAIERDLAKRVNAHRAASGLGTLRYDERIARVAREHSRRMAKGSVGFGHDGMEGRARSLAGQLPLQGMGENIARRHEPVAVAEKVLAGWLDSTVHRDNLDGNYHVTGVGAATGPEGDVFLTQLYVRLGR